MNYTIHIGTISMDLSILYFKGLPIKISIKWYISVPEHDDSLKIVFIFANSADPDECRIMLHCLSTSHKMDARLIWVKEILHAFSHVSKETPTK